MKNLIKKITGFGICLICFSSCFTFSKIEESKSKDLKKKITAEMFEVNKKYLIITEDQTKTRLLVNEKSDDKLFGKIIQEPNFTGKQQEFELVEIGYEQMIVVKRFKFRPLLTLGVSTTGILGFSFYQLNYEGIDVGW